MADTIETRISMPPVELNKGIRKTFFETLFVTGNKKAHRIDVPLLRNGQPVSIPSGAKVEGYLTRYADDVTVRNPGTASGNVVSVTLEKGCYAKTGAFALTIQVTVDGVTNTIFWGESSIFSSAADTVIDGDYIIYDLAELLKRIDAMKAATEAANTAATNADKATEAAETATTNADSAVKAANTAATNADNATEAANTAATSANNATEAANKAAEKIDNMTVQVSGLEAGATPTANLELVDGHYNLSFAIPKGDKGNTGATGATPQITVKVVTGEPGTAASVAQSGTAEAPIITLTIPRGDTGSLGSLTINGKTPDSAGKVELTAADVGARADDWMPTAADVGALSGTDATLTQTGKAADAKATGDALNQLKTDVDAKINQSDALTLEEIMASTGLSKKVASAEAVKAIKNNVGTLKQGNFYTESNKGNTMPAVYGGFIRISGRSWPGNFDGDTYYFGVDADSIAYSGTQINGAAQVTWKTLQVG
jgi:hypothetical protein